jgi:uncharacterized protein YbjQ (UPF0145 family)
MADAIIGIFILCINLLPFIVLICLGLFVGRYREKAHFRDLDTREADVSGMLITEIRTFPGGCAADSTPTLLVAEVTIATDYLKNFLASLRNIFGGEVRSYRTLMERARREAMLRVVEEAREKGYDAVCNMRLETADIGGATTRRKVAMCSVIASGTAYRRQIS